MTYDLTALEPRPYQQRATDWALERSQGVICLPTGTGKTLVGCQWACSLLNAGRTERVLVLEPSRFLVEQVHAYYDEYTTLPTEKLDGTTPPSERRGTWDAGRVVVTTPHTAVNDSDQLSFDAVLIDECHHTTGQHACAQLLQQTAIPHQLGLSATIPSGREREIEAAIGPVRRRSWTDLPDEHVPTWIGHIYDTPYPDRYWDIVDELEAARLEFEGTQLAGFPAIGLRMLSRDGALALEETVATDTKMGEVLHSRLAPALADCQPLHKQDVCTNVLETHAFDKAVIFVDRVVVAKALNETLAEIGYTTVCLLGRLHSSRSARHAAVDRAWDAETDVIIATSAGEEGIDLPAADLLIVWSNVVSSVRFVQRLGRIMRPDTSDAPRIAVYLATPDSPDYEALRRGLAEAKRAGLDVAQVDENTVLSRSVVARVQDALDGTPRQRGALAALLAQPERTVTRWLRTNVRDGDVFYLYRVPEDLADWRKAAAGIAKWVGIEDEISLETGGEQGMADAIRNNFSPGKDARYYLRESDIDLLETDFPTLVAGDWTNQLQVSFGPSHQERGADSARGTVNSVVATMTEELSDADTVYATVSYQSSNPDFAVQMLYQGSATEPVLETIARNADAVITELLDRVD